MIYSYTKNNLLGKVKEHYKYSSFDGKDFIDAYMQDRKDFLIGEETVDESWLTKKLSNNFSATFEKSFFLEMFVDVLFKKNKNIKLDKIIQSFEVTKRLFSIYDDSGRRLTDVQVSSDSYIFFSGVLAVSYASFPHPIILNALLKVNDIVISLKEKVMKNDLKTILIYSCSIEVSAVKQYLRQA